DGVLERVLGSALLGAQLGQLPADGHEVARAPQRVAADVLEDVLTLAGVIMSDHVGAEEGAERVGLQPAWGYEVPRRLAADVVHEDLTQAGGRVDDVDRAATILLGHRGGPVELGERLLANCDEDLQLVTDPVQLIRYLDEPHLGEVPDVRRLLSRV